MKAERILLTPLTTPEFKLQNRVVMAPMNRRRAINGIPGSSASVYFGQRAGAGLIITDNTAVAPNGIGYLHTPGIFNSEQQAGWQQVVEEVHTRSGKIFVQLVHSGRIGHPLNHERGEPLVAPSAVPAPGKVRIKGGCYLPMPEPEVLSSSGIQTLTDAFIQAAERAMEVGFDGVEIHGAHGFLLEQFLNPYTNDRTDCYGGNIVNRSRFMLEVMEGVAEAIGKDRTGIRLSPFSGVNGLPPYAEENTTYHYLIDKLREMDILYIHLSNQPLNGKMSISTEFIKRVRKDFPNLLILAGGYTADSGEAVLAAGLADLIAFGRPFISNPDLVERFRHNAPLASWDEETFYQGGDEGYIDYQTIYSSIGAIKHTV